MSLTPDQKFLFDLQGFILLDNILTPDEIAAATDAIHRLCRAKVSDPAQWDERGQPRDVIRVFRPIEKDPFFLPFVDHPGVFPILQELVGGDPLLVDNDVELSPAHQRRQGWHRGIGPHGYWTQNGTIFCTMVKAIWYLSDIGPGQNATRIVPGSHKSAFPDPIPLGDSAGEMPGQVELYVKAGTVLLFSEACLHAGNVNASDKTRVTMYFNYGPSWVQPWEGYRPSAELLAQENGARKQVLGGGKVYCATEDEGRELYS